jgi:hypothetical protein
MDVHVYVYMFALERLDYLTNLDRSINLTKLARIWTYINVCLTELERCHEITTFTCLRSTI